MARAVMDASALLAYLQGEKGATALESALADSCISAVNLAEVLSKLVDGGMELKQACSILRSMPILVVPFDRDLAERVANLRALTRKRGISLGDRACIALGEREKATVFTADREWQKLGLEVDIHTLR